MKTRVKLTTLFVAVCLLIGVSGVPEASANSMDLTSQTATEIYTVEDLQAVAQNPSGSYILMADLDLSGVSWIPLDFTGTFDGNGHTIVNLSLSEPGREIAMVFDGNAKEYDASFVGLFGTLRNAEVKNLNLLNVRALVESDTPCMVGGIAGYTDLSTIDNCTVSGCLELRAHDRMFGVGGVVGFGTGTVQNSAVDVTLICTDTDANTLDEQFLGGIFSTGFMNVLDCQIKIDGYCSEFGYVHNGGITGMLKQHPAQNKFGSTLRNNFITGKITFFECNPNRRAYCHPEAGEILSTWYTVTHNKHEFLRDERKEYDVELRPEMCADPSYSTTVVEPGCDSYGYTQYRCNGCGYEYTDHYTLFQHTVDSWKVQEEPTTEQTGLSVGSCSLCGVQCQRVEAVLEAVPAETQPVPTEVMIQTEPPKMEEEPASKAWSIPVWIWAFPAAGVVILLCFLLRPRRRQRGGSFLKNNRR